MNGVGGYRFGLSLCATLVLSAALAACSASQPPFPALPAQAIAPHGTLVGIASWYGPGFNGHHTSNGEIYDQEDLTAASNIFPLGTYLMVTNLANHRAVEVRINDHGPYVRGRAIDLSHKAARMLGMLGPGTARVRMHVLSTPPGGAGLVGHEVYFVQVGSFTEPANAERLRERLAVHYNNVSVDPVAAGVDRYYRVRMGAFETYREAEQRAHSAAHFGLAVVIVQE
ncbi:MAG: septal ring lytic transglycosylase RlpA family protein [Candidatus Binataceae bacterium]